MENLTKLIFKKVLEVLFNKDNIVFYQVKVQIWNY